jgi:nucleoside-diphosphate-sugar epimerase
MAAHFGGRDFAGMLAAEQVNAEGALKLCHACKNAGVRHLVHISTTYVTLAEDSPFYGVYALSKRHGEELVTLYCGTAGLPLTILRPSQIYGAGHDSRKHQPLFYHVIDKADANQDIHFYGSNDALRNLIHADDVAQAVARVVRARIEGIYACASLQNVRCSEIAQAAISAFNSTSRITFLPDKPDIPDNPFAADDTLYRKLGWAPAISLEAGMLKEAAERRTEACG